jgi:hypothetical protein
MVFQNAPATFDGIIFAVLGWIVGEFQRQLGALRELDQPLHELRAGTGNLRAVVQIDQQAIYSRMRGLAAAPPQFQAIRYEVAGVARRAEDDVELMVVDFENAGRGEHRVGMHVVIERRHGLLAASDAASRKLADLHLGLGVQGNTQRLWLLGDFRVNLLQVVEDGVGLGNFFGGLVLRTRRKQ